MAGVSRIGDSILGSTGEHSGHTEPPHGSIIITGDIANGSGNVFINGIGAAYVGSITNENDACCGSSTGTVAQGSSTVFVNGKQITMIGCIIAPHSGTVSITGGSGNVYAN